MGSTTESPDAAWNWSAVNMTTGSLSVTKEPSDQFRGPLWVPSMKLVI